MDRPEITTSTTAITARARPVLDIKNSDRRAGDNQRVGAPHLAPIGLREVREGGDLLHRVPQHHCHHWQLRLQHQRDGLDLGPDQRAGGLGEDGRDRSSDHLALTLGDPGQAVAHEVDLMPTSALGAQDP
jgi:hypothetical protein